MLNLNQRKGNRNVHCHCSIIKFIILKTWFCVALISVLVSIICVNVVDAKGKGKDTEKLDKIRCEKDQYGNNNCTCPDDPITERYIDKDDVFCQFYFLCHLGVAIKMQCAPFFAFHPKLKECLERDRIQKNICKPLVDCPVSPNRYIEDPTDCTKFYLCYFGKHYHWTCPEGKYFEPNKETCVPDKAQAEACMIVSKKNFYKKLGLAEKPPPKTSKALDEAKAYKKANPKPNQKQKPKPAKKG